MEIEDDDGINVIAKNIPELAFKSLNLLNDMKNQSELNLNISSENDQLQEHFETYYEKFPIKPVTFKDISLEWFNVSEPLCIEEHLNSHIVILDFFTYCCINCLHILPDLEALEEKYLVNRSPVVVIGMHSGKFDNERLTHNVADAIKRFNIVHPVANDVNCKLWTTLGISCWPTLLILGPNGSPIFVLMGEGHRESLFMIVDESIKYFSKISKLNPKYLPLMPSLYLPSFDTSLYYPGKVSSYVDGLIISDSGNNRIILINYDGAVKKVIGCGKKGFEDGTFDEACFSNPQGAVYHPSNYILVADTNNHAIRKIDLKHCTVTTLSGNGKQNTCDNMGGNVLTEQTLSSPWDICLSHSIDAFGSESLPNLLLIAMAGSHQIWGLFLTDGLWLKNCHYVKGKVVCLAGSGLEENRNTSYPLKAGFAQPSGICLSTSAAGQIAYIADSESSSIRQFSLIDGAVKKVAGGALDPTDLFAYGDVDGVGAKARFQHPMGVACNGDTIYVADSYNHKIKTIKKEGKIHFVETLIGGKISEDLSGDINENILNEPGGICFCLERKSIFIADTNNFCIKELCMGEENLRKMEINFQKLSDYSEDTVDSMHDNFILCFLPDDKNEIILKIDFQLPPNMHPTPEMKQKYEIITTNSNISCIDRKGYFDDKNMVKVPITVNQSSPPCESSVIIKASLYVCLDEGVCSIKEISQNIKFVRDAEISTVKSNSLHEEIDIHLSM